MSLLSEFKEFAVKGNAIELAVGVVIGGAFQAIFFLFYFHPFLITNYIISRKIFFIQQFFLLNQMYNDYILLLYMVLAVGVVIGGAFQAIVTSLVNDIIMPFASLLTGKVDYKDWIIQIGVAKIQIGSFITVISSISSFLFFKYSFC